MSKTGNLLELVMIVKDSGDEIITMLNAIKNYIDHWTILDTGSTDNTKENITKCLTNVPGNLYDAVELYDEPFVDFSTARNRALDLAKTQCTFTIMLDDTYVLQDGPELIKFLEKNKNSEDDGYTVIIEDKQNCYPSTRILRSAANKRYKHKIHEYIDIESKGPAAKILDLETDYMTARSNSRKESDKRLMEEELELYPNDRRMMLHLARHILNSDREAAKTYLEKILCSKKDTLDYEARSLLITLHPDIRQCAKVVQAFGKKYPREVESTYYVALLFKARGKPQKAYKWIVKAAGAQTKMSHTIRKHITDLEIPYIFADIAISMKKTSAVEKVLKTYLPRHNDTRLLNMVYAVSNIAQNGQTLQTPIIVFHATNVVKAWSPKNFHGHGFYPGSGSEIMCANLATEFAKMGFRVFVFGSFVYEDYDSQGMYDGVQYMDISFYQQFITSYIIDVLVVSRDTDNLIYHKNVKKVFLWVHDTLPMNLKFKQLLHIQYDPKKFKKILCLCNWHKNFVAKGLNVEKTKIFVTRNAIKVSKFARLPKKIPFRFIYASGAQRGLEHLLRLIPLIKAEFPETTLHVFCNLDGANKKGNSEQLKRMISDLPYVTLRGRVSQEEISHEYSISDVWFYPTDFPETYCITALEAQAAGCLCACTGLSSLKEIVGSRGIVGGENIRDEEVARNLTEDLINIMKDETRKKELTTTAREWALKQSYSQLAKDWKNKLFCL
jgi:glycosyltransferase involved in cell wall biosynthesis